MSALPAGALAPIEKRVRVKLQPEDAFELFTSGLSRWWPLATHSCAGADAVRVDIEPRAGGRVVESARDGSIAQWGVVLVWDPPRRFVMTWHPGSSPAEATYVDVEFSRRDDGCEIHLLHSGWEARAHPGEARGRYEGGWTTVLARYTAHAEQGER